MPPKFYYQKNANKSFQWHGMDNLEMFEYNSKNISDFNDIWNDIDISYKFNSNGFRNEEFEYFNNALFLGCSFTLGEAIPVDLRWTKIISQALMLNENNLAVTGASGDTCFRLANYWVEKLNPKYVFVLYPFKHRREEFKNDTVYSLYPNADAKKVSKIVSEQVLDMPPHDEEIFNYHNKIWLSSQENILINYTKNLAAIENICSKNNAKLFIICFEDILNNVFSFPRGRDQMHPGIEAHKYIANLFLEKMD